MSIITLEKIVEPINVLCYTSIITLEKIIEPMYIIRPICEVDHHTGENRRTDVSSSSDIRCRLLH